MRQLHLRGLVLAAFILAVAGVPKTVLADPPPWAPAHGYKKKHHQDEEDDEDGPRYAPPPPVYAAPPVAVPVMPVIPPNVNIVIPLGKH